MNALITKTLFICCIATVVTGCKLAVNVGEGGDALSSSGSSDCLENNGCEFVITDATFSESFTAVAKVGYRFVKWRAGEDYLCPDSANPTCVASNTEYQGNAAAEAVIASDKVYSIEPIFEQVSGFLGATSGAYDWTTSTREWYGACQAEYGASAVWCSDTQIWDSPSFVSMPEIGEGIGPDYLDDYGMWVRSYKGNPQNLLEPPVVATCQGGGAAFVLFSNLQMLLRDCVEPSRPIACCR